MSDCPAAVSIKPEDFDVLKRNCDLGITRITSSITGEMVILVRTDRMRLCSAFPSSCTSGP